VRRFTATVAIIGVLTADQANANYQWYECPNMLITGETNKSFSPPTSGSFKVVITNGSCSRVVVYYRIYLRVLRALKTKYCFYVSQPSAENVTISSSMDGDFTVFNLVGQWKTFKLKANIETVVLY
jgi:hypothetical protein